MKKKTSGIDLAVYNRPRSAEAEAYRTLRTNLGFISEEEPCRSILVTSPGQADGKSTVAASLAVVLAQAGNKVMLVDGDLRRPSMHEIFNLDNRHGFSNCLMEDQLPEGYATRTLVDNLMVMTSGQRPPNPAELMTTPKVSMIISALLKSYDYVILDSPPVLAVTDAVLLANKVEGVLLVLGSGRTNKNHAIEAHKRFRMASARILGVVINRMPIQSQPYNKYYE